MISAARTPPTSLPPSVNLHRGLEEYAALKHRLDNGEIRLPRPAARARRPASVLPREFVVEPFKTVDAEGSAYDASLAVGRSHALVVVNFALGIYTKAGGEVTGSRDLRAWFPNLPRRAGIVFDPRALYDQYADRWIVAALAWDHRARPKSSWILLAVSSTGDPTGKWSSWVFDAALAGRTSVADSYADYPALGIDERAVYLTVNMRTGRLTQAKLRIFPKAALYGGDARFMDFVALRNPDGDAAISAQPAHAFGSSDVALLASTRRDDTDHEYPAITRWTVIGLPAAPRLDRRDVPIVDAYRAPLSAPQQTEAKRLDTGQCDVRGAVTRNSSLRITFATSYTTPTGSFNAVRWYELEHERVADKGELADDDAYYCFPAVMPDRLGNVVMVASRSAADEFPSIHCGMWPTTGADKKGVLVEGTGPHHRCRGNVNCTSDDNEQHPTRNGWADYNGIALDPVDERIVWVCGAVAPANDPSTWQTWLAAIR